MWDSRNALVSLLDILTIFNRTDLKTEVMKELAHRALIHAGSRPGALGGTARRIRPLGRSHARPARPSGTGAAPGRGPQQRQTAREHTGRHLRLRPARLSLLVAAPDRAPHRRPPQMDQQIRAPT